ncbi:MAG: hypothetical protein RBU37_26100 [Myxococcota bacterium]|jgi:hypothetical protein|nr:hypothetical protein [Myxococcota bacterium]
MAEPHTLSFFRAGGIDQLSLRSGRDLAAVAELDPKLWVAIAMPVNGVELDAKTLGYVDTDNDGRIRVPEIIAAVKWVLEVVADPDELLKKDEGVELSALKKGPVRAAAKRILEDLGKAELKRIELSDVADTAKVFAQTRFNGDGIVPVDAADDDAQRKLIEDIIATHDSVPDRSGKPGIDKAKLDAFFAEAKAFVEWWAKPTSDEALRPVDDSAAAADAYESVRAKIDDYFARCRLVEFDPRATALVNGAESELASLAAKDVAQAKDDVAKLPLARVEAGRPLPLEAGVNPAWADAIARFATLCVKPLLGHATSTLSAAEWLRVGEKFAPFLAWRASKPAGNVEKLGAERLREIAAGDGQAALAKLIEDDAALAKDYEQLSQVEKALLF